MDDKIEGECHGKRGDEHTSSVVCHEKERVVHTSKTTNRNGRGEFNRTIMTWTKRTGGKGAGFTLDDDDDSL